MSRGLDKFDVESGAGVELEPQVQEVRAKVVVVGDAGVGKTSLVRRYVWNEFTSDYLMTLGVVVSKRAVDVVLEDRRVRVTMILWDTMGERVLAEALREAYLRDARGVIAVCDASDAGTVPALRSWLDVARRVAPTAALGILLNKSDLGVRPEARDAALRAALEHAAPCYLTSARTAANVGEAFGNLAARLAAAPPPPPEGFDPVSMGLVIDASVRPRCLADLARSARLPSVVALARAEALVRQGYLRLASMDLDPDGRPVPTFTATGKSFPPLSR